MINAPAKRQINEFNFDLVSEDGVKVFVGTFRHETIEKGIKEARKACNRLALPGWRLVCRETGGGLRRCASYR